VLGEEFASSKSPHELKHAEAAAAATEERMLRADQNDFITRTGHGTPMGQLFRSYWTPALLAEELSENDCPPVRVKVLSERLIAFRDSKGQLGLIDEFCAHRGVSLWFGRNEECGLRCPYHGWKFDVTGQCVEVPSEPTESGFAKRIKLKSYPLIEQGGVLWTYMGPPDQVPPLPQWEFSLVPAGQRFVSKRLQECNWLQAMEGGIDSSHVINGLTKGDWLEALLFALAVAVGLTPEMLPMIVTANLAKGATAMSRKRVIVQGNRVKKSCGNETCEEIVVP
jgi:nitrite reductase/ring-hydroxylating ferredoxin subunit